MDPVRHPHPPVLLLDQRGTGRSTPLTGRAVAGMTDGGRGVPPPVPRRLDRGGRRGARARLAGGRPWETLGQSYGGFVTMAYLAGARGARRLLRDRRAARDRRHGPTTSTHAPTRAWPARTPSSMPATPRTPHGTADREPSRGTRRAPARRRPVHPRRFRMLGSGFGMGDGYDKLHWLLDEAARRGALRRLPPRRAHGDRLRGRAAVRAAGVHLRPARPAADGVGGRRAIWPAPGVRGDHDPLLFTGEMFYRWMFEEIAALRPFLGAADLLASYDDWPPSTTSTGSPPTRCRCARPSTSTTCTSTPTCSSTPRAGSATCGPGSPTSTSTTACAR